MEVGYEFGHGAAEDVGDALHRENRGDEIRWPGSELDRAQRRQFEEFRRKPKSLGEGAGEPGPAQFQRGDGGDRKGDVRAVRRVAAALAYGRGAVVAQDYPVRAAAVAGAGVGFDEPVGRLEAEGSERLELLAGELLPVDRAGCKAGHGFEGTPGGRPGRCF